MDVYEPTKFALDNLYNKISKNGVILIDDFYGVEGATLATKEFLSKKKKVKNRELILRQKTLLYNKAIIKRFTGDYQM